MKNDILPSSSTKTISVDQLGLFLSSPHKFKVLSLDCFDTLLWRRVARPEDVFYELQSTYEYKQYGMTAITRSNSESRLRKIREIKGQSTELNLSDIYKYAMPHASAATIDELVQAEVNVEKSLCSVFYPVFELLSEAKLQGLTTILVSDTYLNESQLRELVLHCFQIFILFYCDNNRLPSKTRKIFRKFQRPEYSRV